MGFIFLWDFFFCLMTNTIEIKMIEYKQHETGWIQRINIYTHKHKHKSEPCHKKFFFCYVFRRFFARDDDVSRIDVSINGRFLLSSLTLTNDDLDDLIFSTSSNENGSGLIRIVNLGTVRRGDKLSKLLSVLDDRELIEDELEWRVERIVGRQIRKLGLFECGVVDNDVDDEEYCDDVRWRFRGYDGEDEENDEDEEVDDVGDSKRVGRVVIVDN